MSAAAPVSGEALLDALERGEARAAEPDGEGGWRVHPWVKEGLLALFRTSQVGPAAFELPEAREPGPFRDKRAFGVRRFGAHSGVRVVPGGTAIRRGAHLAPGVVVMPPAYVNVGAFVDRGTMIDSHALVGSCAQVGRDVHLSAAAQLGGVLEPPGARPVIVEDEAFIGGGACVFEGVLVRRRAVLAAGVVLTATTPLFDLVHERVVGGTRDAPLEVPEGAVVVPGTRRVPGPFAAEHGLATGCALVVKYRDERTDRATALEEALRAGGSR